jgi:hypothetical protein
MYNLPYLRGGWRKVEGGRLAFAWMPGIEMFPFLLRYYDVERLVCCESCRAVSISPVFNCFRYLVNTVGVKQELDQAHARGWVPERSAEEFVDYCM